MKTPTTTPFGISRGKQHGIPLLTQPTQQVPANSWWLRSPGQFRTWPSARRRALITLSVAPRPVPAARCGPPFSAQSVSVHAPSPPQPEPTPAPRNPEQAAARTLCAPTSQPSPRAVTCHDPPFQTTSQHRDPSPSSWDSSVLTPAARWGLFFASDRSAVAAKAQPQGTRQKANEQRAETTSHKGKRRPERKTRGSLHLQGGRRRHCSGPPNAIKRSHPRIRHRQRSRLRRRQHGAACRHSDTRLGSNKRPRRTRLAPTSQVSTLAARERPQLFSNPATPSISILVEVHHQPVYSAVLREPSIETQPRPFQGLSAAPSPLPPRGLSTGSVRTGSKLWHMLRSYA